MNDSLWRQALSKFMPIREVKVSKTNPYKKKPFTGEDKEIKEKTAEELFKDYDSHACYCSGANKEKHTWYDPRCVYYRPKLSGTMTNVPQLLPPPHKASAPEQGGSAQQINSQTSMFQNQGSPNACVGMITREEEVLCSSYNRMMMKYPQDFSSMLDGNAMTLKCIRHIVDDLHLHGYIVQEEENPFGC